MPARLGAQTNRRFVWALWACALVLVAGIVVTAPPAPEYAPVPSIYASGSGGARAAYLLLRDLHFDVRVWEEPPAGLAALATQFATPAVLILAEPSESPSKADVASLRKFVEAGGRVLFCGASIPKFFPKAEVSDPVEGIEWKEFSANLPSATTRDANRVIIRPEVYWGRTDASQIPLYGSENSAAVVVLWKLGKGEVLWWAGATPLTNAGITRSGNLNLFLNSVGASHTNLGTPIYWDEYFHGERVSLFSYVEKTPVVWAGVQILLVALILLFTFSRRSGPIVMPGSVSRLSPLEFVDTMGALYQHAGASSIPVDVCRHRLRLQLTRRLGLPSATPDADLARVAAERLHFDRASLAETLNRASGAAAAPKLRTRDALALVQDLERYKEKD
jgi:hypothetical protein